MINEIVGRVTVGAGGNPPAGLRVGVMDADFLVPDPLDLSPMDEDGGFHIMYDVGEYRHRFGRAPDVYVVVYGDGERVLTDTRAAVVRGAGPRQEVYVQLAEELQGPPPGALVMLAGRTLERGGLERLRRPQFLALARTILTRGKREGKKRKDRVASLFAELRLTPAADLLAPGLDLTPQIRFLEEVALVRGWEQEFDALRDALRRPSNVQWITHSCPPFLITYTLDGESGVDLKAAVSEVLHPGTSDVAGHTSGTKPDYIERICFWLHFALSLFTGPPANLRPLPSGAQIDVFVFNSGAGVSGTGAIHITNDFEDDRLAWTVVHELAHLIQMRYETSGRGAWHRNGEGCASLAEEFVMDRVNRYLAEAGDATAEAGILGNPTRSIIERDHRQALFLKYFMEQHISRSAGAGEATASLETFRVLLESFDRGGYTTAALEQAVRTLPWYQSLFRFEYLDIHGPDALASETLLGNFWLACYLKDLKDAPPDPRFDFLEKDESSLLPQVVPRLAPLVRQGTHTLLPDGTITLAAGDATVPPFGAQFFRVDLDPGVDTVRVRFSADRDLKRPLVQIVEMVAVPGASWRVRDILRSDHVEWIRTIASRPVTVEGQPPRLALDHLLIVVAGTEDSVGHFSLTVQSIPPTPDVMVTRWNCGAGTHYEVDPFNHAWTWTSPDVWVDNDRDDVPDDGVVPGRDNRLCVRLRNHGNQAAVGIQVEFWYQAAGGTLSELAWRRVKDAAGVDQVLTGQKLPAQSASVFSVNWAPTPLLETGAYSLRVVVTVPGDPNTDDKRCLSNLAVATAADGQVEVGLLRRAFRAQEEVQVVVIPRGHGGFSATHAELRRINKHRVTVASERVDRLRLRRHGGRTRRENRFQPSSPQSPFPDPLTYYPVHPDTLPPGFAERNLVTVAHLVEGRVVGGFTWAIRDGSLPELPGEGGGLP
jgi:hypothetical protein